MSTATREKNILDSIYQLRIDRLRNNETPSAIRLTSRQYAEVRRAVLPSQIGSVLALGQAQADQLFGMAVVIMHGPEDIILQGRFKTAEEYVRDVLDLTEVIL